MYNCEEFANIVNDLLVLSEDTELWAFEKFSAIIREIDIDNCSDDPPETYHEMVEKIKEINSLVSQDIPKSLCKNKLKHILTEIEDLRCRYIKHQSFSIMSDSASIEYNSILSSLTDIKNSINDISYDYYNHIFAERQAFYVNNIDRSPMLVVISGFNPENIMIYKLLPDLCGNVYLIVAMVNNHAVAQLKIDDKSHIVVLDETMIIKDFKINGDNSCHRDGIGYIELSTVFVDNFLEKNAVPLELLNQKFKVGIKNDYDSLVKLNRIPKAVESLTLTKCTISMPEDLSNITTLILNDTIITTDILTSMRLKKLSLNYTQGRNPFLNINFIQLTTIECLEVVIHKDMVLPTTIHTTSNLNRLEILVVDSYDEISKFLIPEHIKSLKLSARSSIKNGPCYTVKSKTLETLEISNNFMINLETMNLPMIKSITLHIFENFDKMIPNITTVTDLKMNNCDIKFFNKDTLRPLTHLKNITITNSFIEIECDAFSSIDSLECITLSVDIEDILLGAFDNLPNLKTLDLTLGAHYRKDIPKSLFRGLGNLKKLRLKQDVLTSFPEADLFKDLSSLEELILSNYRSTKRFTGSDCVAQYIQDLNESR